MSHVEKFLHSSSVKIDLTSVPGSNNMEISEASFLFEIPKFGEKPITVSPIAHVRYLPWTIIVQLNKTEEEENVYSSMSVFVQCEYLLNSNWTCRPDITIKLLSSNTRHYEKSFKHSYSRKDCVSGVDPFMLWDVLNAPLNGYIVDNTIVLEVTIKCDEPKCVPWNSKRHTTFIGLENRMENSYLNSLIQILYSIKPFRTSAIGLAKKSKVHNVIGEMQQIFHQLDASSVPVSIDQFIKSIGNGTYNAIKTNDTEYFFNFLYKSLEKYATTREMWGLFQGQISTVSKSTDKLEITKFRKLNGIKLKLSGDEDINEMVRASFAKIDSHSSFSVMNRRASSVNPSSRNQIIQLPSILILHLDRQQDSAHFVIEHRKDMKFGKDIDFSDYVPNSADSSTKYVLHAILARCNKFSAFVRRQGSGSDWLKFDNDIVSHCTEKEAIEDNFRCVQMLVYLKCSDINKYDKDSDKCPELDTDGKAIINCVICMEVRKDSVIYSTVCGHIFCGVCIRKEIELRQRCPVCTSFLTEADIHPIYI